jgi:thiopurine S-methyltransferase
MEFWHNRWVTDQIGWHRTDANEMLVKHWPSLNLASNAEVLVPLCGKSLDMVWLADQGHEIVGLELVAQAVESFFLERNAQPEKEAIGQHVRYSSPPFTVIQGDLFALETNTVQADAWYDRAAMIALPNSQREAYVEQLRQQTKVGAVGLLITYAYPQDEMEGPPFALHDDDVRRFYTDGFEVEPLEHLELEDERDRGLSSITLSVFKVTRT